MNLVGTALAVSGGLGAVAVVAALAAPVRVRVALVGGLTALLGVAGVVAGGGGGDSGAFRGGAPAGRFQRELTRCREPGGGMCRTVPRV